MKAVSKLKLWGFSCSFTPVFALSDAMVLMELVKYIVTYWVNRIISWTFLQELHKTMSLADSELFLRFLNRRFCCERLGHDTVSSL